MGEMVASKQKPWIVGSISTEGGLARVHRKAAGALNVHWIEVRLDHLLAKGVRFERVKRACQEAQAPILLTARSQKEGGAWAWKPSERAEMIHSLLPYVAAIDLELNEIRTFQPILKHAIRLKRTIILSTHFLNRSFAAKEKRLWQRRLATFHMACPCPKSRIIYKVAARCDRLDQLRQLARLILQQAEWYPKRRIAVMGIGKLAQKSRLVLAAFGSELVYGYLDEPIAPGQPYAPDLARSLPLFFLK